MPNPIKISFSKISCYIECPRKYMLSYMFKLGTGSSPHMTNGTLIHKCAELFADWSEEEQTWNNLLEKYYELVPELDDKNLIHESVEGIDGETGEILQTVMINPVFEEKAKKSLKSFYDDYMENAYSENKKMCGPNRGDKIKPNIIMQEEWFNIKTEDGHELRGLIDRVDEEPDGEHIIDYKSGQSRTTYKALQDPLDMKAMQLSIYSLARFKKTGKIPYKSSFFYVEPTKGNKVQKGEYRTAPKRTEEQLNKVEEFINDICNEIASNVETYNFPANEQANCFWCDFKDKCHILANDEITERKNSMQIEKKKPTIVIDTSDWD